MCTKKVFAILLTGVLAMSVFTGCQTANEATPSATPGTEAGSTPEVASAQAEAEVTESAPAEAEDQVVENTDEEYDGPSDFVQEQSGKLEFEDYNEIIGYLEPGQGFAYLKIGDDDDTLAVAENVDAETHTAESASIYVMKDGKPLEVGYVSG